MEGHATISMPPNQICREVNVATWRVLMWQNEVAMTWRQRSWLENLWDLVVAMSPLKKDEKIRQAIWRLAKKSQIWQRGKMQRGSRFQ